MVLLAWFLGDPLYGGIYKWADEKGKVHFTENPGQIPPQYREKNKLEVIENEDSSAGTGDYPRQKGLPETSAGNLSSSGQSGEVKPVSKDQLQGFRNHYDKNYKTMTVSLEGLPSLGSHSAPVAIVEFTDYQCPYCRKHVFGALPQINAVYIEKGKVRYMIRDFPLDFHKRAPKAAEAAHCAGDQGEYWKMHHAIFDRRNFKVRDFIDFAKMIGLNTERYQDCMDVEKHKSRVQASFREASGKGISGTPSFVIGKTNGGKVTGYVLSGAQSFKHFSEMIQFFLAY